MISGKSLGYCNIAWGSISFLAFGSHQAHSLVYHFWEAGLNFWLLFHTRCFCFAWSVTVSWTGITKALKCPPFRIPSDESSQSLNRWPYSDFRSTQITVSAQSIRLFSLVFNGSLLIWACRRCIRGTSFRYQKSFLCAFLAWPQRPS